MATITAPSMHDRMYVGTHGNVRYFAGALLQNVAVNDVVDLIEVPIGIKVMGVQIRSSGLGLNVKLILRLETRHCFRKWMLRRLACRHCRVKRTPNANLCYVPPSRVGSPMVSWR
ncbi:hypothetical protein [Vibrio penaeicida]|uniref:hypothetical protein n=1 Tax=Vibrio penaeicida TaxID=104609 RepID=UPI001CC39D45|nr:hypothetical protein [Vibrio penaeicida]